MGFDVDTSVNCDCDECGRVLDESDQLYCESCYTAALGDNDTDDVELETAKCAKCKRERPIVAMFDKIGGFMCRKCAKELEESLLPNAVSGAA